MEKIASITAIVLVTSISLISLNVVGERTWSEDNRLTFDPSSSNFPRVVVDSNNNIHVIWADDRDDNYEIYYAKLDSEGNKIIEDKRITNAPSYSWFPDIAVDNEDNLHIVWIDYRDGRSAIYYTKLDNDGTKLLSDKRLSISNIGIVQPEQADLAMEHNDAFLNDVEHNPTIAVDKNDRVHIAWSALSEENVDIGSNYEIYYALLNSDGITLMNNVRITYAPSESDNPKIALDSFNNVCLVWDDNRNGNFNIYYTKFSKREVIVPEELITNNTSNSREPSIAVDVNDNVIISWGDNRDEDSNQKNYEIYYSKLDKGGNFLVKEERLTYSLGDSYYPTIAIDSNNGVYIAFHDSRNGPSTAREVTEDYYEKIKDNITKRNELYRNEQNPTIERHRLSGENWEIYYIKLENDMFVEERRVTKAPANSFAPHIAIDSKDEIRIFWYDGRDGNEEIYYKMTLNEDFQEEEGGNGNENSQRTISYVGAIIAGALFLSFIFSNEVSKYSTFAFFSPLYSIIKKEKILDQETRENIYKTISTNPGISFTELMQKLNLKNGVLAHHLRTLERGEYIKSARDGKFKRFYLWGQNVSSLSNSQKQILETIKKNPSITQSELAIHLNSTRQAINYQIKNLVKADLIRIEKDGRKTRCYYYSGAS